MGLGWVIAVAGLRSNARLRRQGIWAHLTVGSEAFARYSAPMNALDRNLEGLAHLHYGDGDFAVLKPGKFVLCAVTGKRVAIDALRYWDAETQEAYAGAAEALSAWKARQPRKEA